MTDWSEAGRKADAHRVRDLYRTVFDAPAKAAVRRRVSEALRSVGGTIVLDLWGGGLSANHFSQDGLRVISVDNGSLDLGPISIERKRRALEYAGTEDGYVTRWGNASKFANECDVAFLDFCGPWTVETRRTVAACAHMKAIIVTLMPDHDTISDATSRAERHAAYEVFLRLAFAGRASRGAGTFYSRRLCTYARNRGKRVFVLMVSHQPITLARFNGRDRAQIARTYMSPEQRESQHARYRRIYSKRRQELNARRIAQKRDRLANDPTYRSTLRHYYHVKVARFFSYCPLCQETGQHLPSGLLHSRMLTR